MVEDGNSCLIKQQANQKTSLTCSSYTLQEVMTLLQTIPTEATAFLGAVAAFFAFLLVFYLYLSKKLCFYNVATFPCCDEGPPRKKRTLGSSYNYDDESSSDSEEEAARRIQTSNSITSGINHPQSLPSPLILPQASSSNVGPPLPKPRQKKSPKAYPEDEGRDLISLAEKGRVGGSRSSGSSAPSSCSSTTSGDDDYAHRALRHRDPHGYRMTPYRTHSTEDYSPPPSRCQDDPLFDVTDLQSVLTDGEGPALVSKCGSVQLGFSYQPGINKLQVTIIQARDIPTRERGGANNIQARLVLLPSRKQRYRTKIKSAEDAVFKENCMFSRIEPAEVRSLGLRVRIYGCERMRRERLIGESIIGFSQLPLESEQSLWIQLQPRANLAKGEWSECSSLSRSESTASAQSANPGVIPELMLGLAYNGTTGRLSVEVIKGSHFRTLTMTRIPDTYVKLSLMSSSGQEIAHSKSSVRRAQPNPLFKETFMFQVALFQLPDVTLLVSVFNRRSIKRKEMIGWFSLGLSSSGEEERSHWGDMRDSKGEQVCRWHILLES